MKNLTLSILMFSMLIISPLNINIKAENKQFTLILDAGHGGKDPGALGKKGREKDINLKVALEVGKLIKKQHPEVKIVYTRSTDKYVSLKDRSIIANKNDGDFFISIHTNASESKNAYGAETYTLGASKTQANFEVAKRENAVMLLDDDDEVYQNFDPNSPESYIMFQFMQSTYIDQSVEVAHYVQKEFVTFKRLDRSVRQAGFWLLHSVKMPSILIELGFITNAREENYLVSLQGQSELSQSISNAFHKYKHEYDKRTPSASTQKQMTESAKTTSKTETKKEVATQNVTTKKESSKPAKQTTHNNDIQFRIQTFVSKTELLDSHNDIIKITKYGTVNYTVENGWYKYTCGNTSSYEDILQIKNNIKSEFPDAFIVAFKKNKKIPVTDAIKESKK